MGAVEILNLTQAFEEKQAHALAQFFDANTASKKDIEDVRLEAEQVRGEVQKLREELHSEVTKLQLEIKADLEKVKAELAFKILQYQVGGVLSIAVIMGLFRLLG